MYNKYRLLFGHNLTFPHKNKLNVGIMLKFIPGLDKS